MANAQKALPSIRREGTKREGYISSIPPLPLPWLSREGKRRQGIPPLVYKGGQEKASWLRATHGRPYAMTVWRRRARGQEKAKLPLATHGRPYVRLPQAVIANEDLSECGNPTEERGEIAAPRSQ